MAFKIILIENKLDWFQVKKSLENGKLSDGTYFCQIKSKKISRNFSSNDNPVRVNSSLMAPNVNLISLWTIHSSSDIKFRYFGVGSSILLIAAMKTQIDCFINSVRLGISICDRKTAKNFWKTVTLHKLILLSAFNLQDSLYSVHQNCFFFSRNSDQAES